MAKVGLVSICPPLDVKHAIGQGGVSSYTANLLSALPTNSLSYEVYANELPGQPSSSWLGQHIEIIRCWTCGGFSLFRLIRQIATRKPDLIHLQYEVFLFGKGISVTLPALLLIAIKTMNIPLVVTVHGVPPLSKVNGSFVKGYGISIPPFLVKIILWSVVQPVLVLADKIVVHEEEFVGILAEYCSSRRKIVIIPHGIEVREDKLAQAEAKARLGFHGKQILLFFGFLTKYKGLELLIDSMRLLGKVHPDLVLIIAGGDTPGLQVAGKQAYSEVLKERAQSVPPSIHFAGFVEENKIGLYFSAADLVVLPYTIGLSSSGPLALAVAYERPCIVSTALASVVDLDAAIFEPTVQSLVEKVDRFLSDGDLRREIMDYGRKLKTERSWPHVGEQTERLYRDFVGIRTIRDQT